MSFSFRTCDPSRERRARRSTRSVDCALLQAAGTEKEQIMETEAKTRIHPLVAGASIAVIVVSLVGVAALTGYLPGSGAQKAADQATMAAAPAVAPAAPVAPA